MVIYPDIIVDTNSNRIEIRTTTRTEFEGKWYLTKHLQSYQYAEGHNEFHTSFLYQKFIREIYNFLILGRVNIMAVDSNGKSIFELDPNQISERDRLINLYNNNLIDK